MYIHILESVECARASASRIHYILPFLSRRGVAGDRRCGGSGLQQYCPGSVFPTTIVSLQRLSPETLHAPSSSMCRNFKGIPIYRRDNEWSGKLWYASVCCSWWHRTYVDKIDATILTWTSSGNGLHWLDISSTIKLNTNTSPRPHLNLVPHSEVQFTERQRELLKEDPQMRRWCVEVWCCVV